MKIYYKGLVIVFLFMLIPGYVHSEGYMNDNQQQTVSPAAQEKNSVKDDAFAPDRMSLQAESTTETNTSQRIIQQPKQIKAKSICIGDDCRSKWPVFKCAIYDGRPAGETGDEFCGQMDKTCMGVYIGGGQNFFGECSVPASTIHKCRCCWAE